jgi:predicted MFS family arabinose efflux permease
VQSWERRFAPLVGATGFVLAMTAPLEVLYARRFGAGELAVGMFVLSSALGVLAVDVFGTRFVPNLEPRTALVAGIALFGASCLTMGLSPTFFPLVVARAAQGAAGALVSGAGLQAAVRIGASRERALGSFNFALLLGNAAGAPAGGLVATLLPGTSGYRLAFAVCTVLAFTTALATRAALTRLPAAGRAEIGLPRFSGPPVMAPALVLGMLGHYLRGGVVNTALPLVGETRHLSTATIGAAIGLLSVVEIATLRVSGRFFERFSPAHCMAWALTIGVGAATLLAFVPGTVAFVAGALLFGLVVPVTMVGPPLVIISISGDAISGLAAYRIACGVGSLVGSTSVNTTVAMIGAPASLSVVAGVLAGATALVGAVARHLATASTPRSR